MMDIQHQASFFRDALIASLVSPDLPITWADNLIARGRDLPGEMYDLSLAASRGKSHVIEVLNSLAGNANESTIVEALLDLVRRELFANRIDLERAVATIYRISHSVPVELDLRWEMVALEEDYSLVIDGITGDLSTINRIVREWLARFDGASYRYLAPAT